MARTRATAAPVRRRQRGGGAGDGSGLAESAERMIEQLEALVAEILALRAENDALRGEVREAVSMLDRASATLGGAAGAAPRRRRAAADLETPNAAASAPARRRSAGAAPAVGGRGRGRATPPGVTHDVVRAAIGKLGSATAKEIAEEISRAGVPVSGRAIRFFAEGAGAKMEMVDGQRRYRLG